MKQRVFLQRLTSLVLAALALLLWHQSAVCQTIVLFPLLDLTKGPNGANVDLVERIRREIEKRNLEVIDEKDVMQFMILHRIRTLGQLTSHEVVLAGKELGADLVLQGAVCQLKTALPNKISISLQLMRTTDAKIVWAHTEALDFSDLLTPLGIDDPVIIEDLYTVFFPRLFEDFPVAVPMVDTKKDSLALDTVVLRPDYVRPGETVDCKIRLYESLQDTENPPEIIIRVDGKEYKMEPDQDGYYLTASWIAQETQGEYSVELVEKWSSEEIRSGDVGTYIVDNQPPVLRLNIVGKEFAGQTAFSDKLIIIPELDDPEPVSRWLIQVYDEEGELVVNQDGNDELPYDLTWSGKGSDGDLVLDGEYKIVFKVWDQVGFEGTDEANVLYWHMPPDVNIEVNEEGDIVEVNLENTLSTPVSFWWMKFFDGKGKQLKLAQGDTLPASIKIEMPPPAEDELGKVLEGYLKVYDVMGNQKTTKIANLITGISSEEEDEDKIIEKEWVEEF